MTKEDWKKAKEQLERPWPYGRVDLEADGYDVTLEMQSVNDMFHKGILVYVNGHFKGSWLVQDCRRAAALHAAAAKAVHEPAADRALQQAAETYAERTEVSAGRDIHGVFHALDELGSAGEAL